MIVNTHEKYARLSAVVQQLRHGAQHDYSAAQARLITEELQLSCDSQQAAQALNTQQQPSKCHSISEGT